MNRFIMRLALPVTIILLNMAAWISTVSADSSQIHGLLSGSKSQLNAGETVAVTLILDRVDLAGLGTPAGAGLSLFRQGFQWNPAVFELVSVTAGKDIHQDYFSGTEPGSALSNAGYASCMFATTGSSTNPYAYDITGPVEFCVFTLRVKENAAAGMATLSMITVADSVPIYEIPGHSGLAIPIRSSISHDGYMNTIDLSCSFSPLQVTVLQGSSSGTPSSSTPSSGGGSSGQSSSPGSSSTVGGGSSGSTAVSSGGQAGSGGPISPGAESSGTGSSSVDSETGQMTEEDYGAPLGTAQSNAQRGISVNTNWGMIAGIGVLVIAGAVAVVLVLVKKQKKEDNKGDPPASNEKDAGEENEENPVK